MVEPGFKYNMMDLQAAIGIHQLERVETYWKRREAIWQRYIEELGDLPIELPAPVAPDTRHAYHLFILRIDAARCGVSRDAFLEEMTRRKIGVGVHYRSIPSHPSMKRPSVGAPPTIRSRTASARRPSAFRCPPS